MAVTNQTKNTASLTNGKITGIANWDDPIAKWDSVLFTWGGGGKQATAQTKNTATITNQSKS